MRLRLAVLVLLTAFIGACGDDSEPKRDRASLAIRIPVGAVALGAEAYGKNPVSIATGTTVVWINDDDQYHTATSDTGIWNTGAIAPDQASSITFQNVGSFPYHCEIHGQEHMAGTIVVQ